MISFKIFILFFSIVIGQESDSLVITDSKLEGFERINYLESQIYELLEMNPGKAIEFSMEKIQLIKNLNLGDSALASSYETLGVCYYSAGEIRKGELSLERSLNIFREIGLELSVGSVYSNIARMNLIVGNYNKALDYSYRELEIVEKLNKEDIKAFIFERLGLINLNLTNYDKAVEYFSKAETFGLKYDIPDALAPIYSNWGSALLKLNRDNEALTYFNKALEIDQRRNFQYGIAYSQLSMAEILYNQNKYKEAIDNLKSSLNVFKELKYKLDIGYSSLLIGKSYRKLRDYKNAEKYFAEALNIFHGAKLISELEETYLGMALLNEDMGKYKAALYYQKKHSVFRDSTFNKENISKINELQLQYETAEKDKENEFLKLELQYHNDVQKYYLIIGGLVLLIIILSVLWMMKILKTNKRLKELNSTKDKFFTIIAHDLKNPFSSLMGITKMLENDFKENSYEENLISIKALYSSSRSGYKLLENLLDWSKSQTGSIKFEPVKINIKESALSVINLLESNAKNKKIKLESDVGEEEFVMGDKDMINTAIRNIVSNALKYTETGGSVLIYSKDAGDYISVNIRDNGVGINKTDLEKLFRIDVHHSTLGTSSERGTGLGLLICKEFIEKNKGTIFVDSEPGKGTEFRIKLPKA